MVQTPITRGEEELGRLVAIEYAFHFTTYLAAIVATFVIAQIVLSLTRDKQHALPA